MNASPIRVNLAALVWMVWMGLFVSVPMDFEEELVKFFLPSVFSEDLIFQL